MEAGARKGRALPQWYLDEPPIMPGDDFYVRSFWRLHTERQMGTAPGPIPHSACESYALRRGLCEELVDHFCDVMSAMDGAYLGWVNKSKSTPSLSKPQPGHTVVREKGVRRG